MTRTLQLPAEVSGRRLDVVVGEVLGLSRARVKSLFEKGAVRVDGRRPSKGDKATGGSRVEVELAEDAPALVPEPGLALPLLYEDAWLIAVDKPAGMPSHPLKPGETGTAANALVARFPEVARAAEELREGGLVHRLDIDTSGVLLAARDRGTWEAVRALFRERTVDKRYWALVSGPIADAGAIELRLRHKGEARVEPALDGGQDDRVDGVRVGAPVAQGGPHPGALADGVGHRGPVVVGRAEFEHAHQDHQEDRQDQGELDQRLAAVAPHCLGSMRRLAPSETAQVRPDPIGVIPA